jgi:hypothetical protein
MTVTLNLGFVVDDAMKLLGKSREDVEEMAFNACLSRVRGMMDNYVNGNRLPDKRKHEATQVITRTLKSGKRVTIYYKGGLANTAGAAYDLVFGPKGSPTISRQQFIADKCAEAEAIIARLGSGEESDDAVEVEDDE